MVKVKRIAKFELKPTQMGFYLNFIYKFIYSIYYIQYILYTV